jgi:hypothetical protein
MEMHARCITLLALTTAILAGCAWVQQPVEQVEGPFEIALMATTDTRGELEPCG